MKEYADLRKVVLNHKRGAIKSNKALVHSDRTNSKFIVYDDDEIMGVVDFQYEQKRGVIIVTNLRSKETKNTFVLLRGDVLHIFEKFVKDTFRKVVTQIIEPKVIRLIYFQPALKTISEDCKT